MLRLTYNWTYKNFSTKVFRATEFWGLGGGGSSPPEIFKDKSFFLQKKIVILYDFT